MSKSTKIPQLSIQQVKDIADCIEFYQGLLRALGLESNTRDCLASALGSSIIRRFNHVTVLVQKRMGQKTLEECCGKLFNDIKVVIRPSGEMDSRQFSDVMYEIVGANQRVAAAREYLDSKSSYRRCEETLKSIMDCVRDSGLGIDFVDFVDALVETNRIANEVANEKVS